MLRSIDNIRKTNDPKAITIAAAMNHASTHEYLLFEDITLTPDL